jgi:hypothetical protein
LQKSRTRHELETRRALRRPHGSVRFVRHKGDFGHVVTVGQGALA